MEQLGVVTEPFAATPVSREPMVEGLLFWMTSREEPDEFQSVRIARLELFESPNDRLR